MEYNESVKGKEGEWIEEEFCSKDVERFLEAVGYEKEYFLKEKIAPPTFFTVFRKGRPDPEVKGYKTLLHAEQEYEIIRLPKFGEKIRYKTKIKDIYRKESAKTKKEMVFVVFETEFYSGNEIICLGRSTIVFL